MNGQQKRQRDVRRDQLAHQPGGFVAIEEFVRDLQMAVAQLVCTQRVRQMGDDIPDITRAILPGQPQGEIG
ncbi:hypothetical protein D3C76_1283550 [compost metagenome]